MYITNVCKCRPPNNRTPAPPEAEACRPYLVRQIELVLPRVVVCLGGLAARTLIHPEAKVTLARGRVFEKGRVKLVATYHPAALLRDPRLKKPAWEDWKRVRALYREAVSKTSPRRGLLEFA